MRARTPRFVLLAATVAVCLSAPALARPKGEAIPIPVDPPEKMSTLIVYGDDPCPQSKGDEIVVCARQPESERYRVPKRFRRAEPGAAGESWTNRAATLEYVGRAGTPNSCSPVGSGGQTGCYTQFLSQAREERRQAAAAGAAIP
ncbi:hypothetical protein [Sphingomonas profundi]|uniref:hypothetical protein n=1 Tax=Alterirhizorhabdus profundi TaxID=2681549 RepID=UPI0012E75333|nr:hypothetical protein [Sphingomonas profundi]